MVDPVYVGIAVCALFLYIVMLNSNKKLPPGPFILPVLGSVIQLARANSKYPHLALGKFADIYGDIVSFGVGMRTAVVVSSQDAMNEVFRLHDVNMNRFNFSFVNDRNYGKNLGIIWGYGRNWWEVKSFTKKILKEFGYGKIKHMDHSLIDSANQLVDSIKTDLLDSTDGTYAVRTRKFSIHVLNVVWNLTAGYKFNPYDKLLNSNMKCIDKAIHIYGNHNLYNVYPFLKTWFPNLVQYPKHLKIHEEIHGFSKFLINDAKDKRSERLDSEPTSFIEVFLDKLDECHGDPETIFTQEQLEIILEDLILGSLETSGTLVNWSILFMVLNLDVQNKVRRVILDKMASTGQAVLPPVELKKLPYVKATVLEILRMGNVAPISVPRLATKDLEIRDYIIPKVSDHGTPKGAAVMFNLYSMYNEKSYWRDPETFRPERFLTENGEIDQPRSEKILNTVFGIGPRMCFGDSVGLDSLFAFFVALIVNFKFDVIPGQEPRADNPRSVLVVSPSDYSVKVTKLT